MERRLPLYQFMARAGANAKRSNEAWKQVWEEALAQCEDLLPSGSGFDAGTKIEYADADKIILQTSYHHMDNGSYDGWTEHTVTVTPNLAYGFGIRVSGSDKNGVKEYIADVFYDVLWSEVIWDGEKLALPER